MMENLPKETINKWYEEEYSKSEGSSVYKEPKDTIERFIEILKKEKRSKVLEFGCGDGRNLFELAKNGFEVTGIDIHGENAVIQRAKNQSLKIKFIKSDITKLDFDKIKYDAIICSEVLHLIEREYLNPIITKIKQSINPKGLIYLDILTNLKRNFLKTNEPFKYQGQPDYTSKEIIKYFKEKFNDWDVIELDEYHEEQDWPLKKGKYPIEPYHWSGDYIFIITKKQD